MRGSLLLAAVRRNAAFAMRADFVFFTPQVSYRLGLREGGFKRVPTVTAGAGGEGADTGVDVKELSGRSVRRGGLFPLRRRRV